MLFVNFRLYTIVKNKDSLKALLILIIVRKAKIRRYNLKIKINHLSINPTKWSNSLKQFVDCCRRIVWVSLTILWGWRLKGLDILFKDCSWVNCSLQYASLMIRDMVKYKLRVGSYELRVTSWKLKSTSWNSKVRVQIHKLRTQIHELRVRIHELRVRIHEFKNRLLVLH